MPVSLYVEREAGENGHIMAKPSIAEYDEDPAKQTKEVVLWLDSKSLGKAKVDFDTPLTAEQTQAILKKA